MNIVKSELFKKSDIDNKSTHNIMSLVVVWYTQCGKNVYLIQNMQNVQLRDMTNFTNLIESAIIIFYSNISC